MRVGCWDGHDVLNVVMIVAPWVRRGPRVQGVQGQRYEILCTLSIYSGIGTGSQARKAADAGWKKGKKLHRYKERAEEAAEKS